MTETLSSLGEFGLIAAVSKLLPTVPPEWVGVGDDCAVIPPEATNGSAWQVVTTDSMVEGIHFRRETASAFSIGWKLLAVSISDIASMAAIPRGAVLSLHLPTTVEPRWLEDFYRGLASLARREGVFIVGGDTVKSRELAFNLTAWGTTEKPPVLRRGARPGDDVWLSGEIGRSFAGLQILEGALSAEKMDDGGERAKKSHTDPQPRTELARFLMKHQIAHAMIDVSDGLVQDAEHLARASSVRLTIDMSAVAFAPEALLSGLAPARLATAGEDYELLFVASPRDRNLLLSQGLSSPIGSVAAGNGDVYVGIGDNSEPVMQWLQRSGVLHSGHDHFRS